MQVRPLPSAEVVLSSACERYCGPLRLPGQPPATSGFALIRRGGTPVVHWTGSPVVPCDAVRACRPCYPGGFPPARQLWWLWEHRPSPNVHRVGTLSLVTRLRLGSLRATACAVARPSGALVRELSALGYPSHLPQATWADCQLPGPDFHRQVSQYPRHADVAALVALRGHCRNCRFRPECGALPLSSPSTERITTAMHRPFAGLPAAVPGASPCPAPSQPFSNFLFRERKSVNAPHVFRSKMP